MSELWTIDAMAAAMGGDVRGVTAPGVGGLSTDTRTLSPGDAYFAIKGDVHDGHRFVAAAHAAGAAVSVVARGWLDRLEGETGGLIVVDDVLDALVALAQASRARSNARIVAVTGSVGKTSTKEMLRSALSACGRTHASVASYNNHWGVPLTLARMPADTQFGVFEIGMNHPDEITPLVRMVRPHVAVITNVAAVHLGAFDSVDGIAHAKAEIFDGLNDEGTALLNADDERFGLLSAIAADKGIVKVACFGEAEGADVRLRQLATQDASSTMTADVFGQTVAAKVGVPGRHMVQNALVVLGVAQLLGADLALAAQALAGLEPVKGRGARHAVRVRNGEALLIDESYNANPSSMRAAIALLGEAPLPHEGRRFVALGDMLELGPTSAALHAGLAEPILAHGIDAAFLAGPQMKALADALQGHIPVVHATDVDALIPSVAAELRAGDAIMAKASLGQRFARLVDRLIAPEPEQTTAA